MKVKMDSEDQFPIFPVILLIIMVNLFFPVGYIIFSLLSNNPQHIQEINMYIVYGFSIIAAIVLGLWIYNVYKKPKPVEATLLEIEEVPIEDKKKWILTFKLDRLFFSHFKCYIEEYKEFKKKQKYIIFIKEYNHSVYQVEDIKNFVFPKETSFQRFLHNPIVPVTIADVVFFICAYISYMGSFIYPESANTFRFLVFVFFAGIGYSVYYLFNINKKK